MKLLQHSRKRIIIGFSLIVGCPLIGVKSYADVVIDKTLGTVQEPLELTGPQLDIKQEYGVPVGANLFHSFEKFNVNLGQTATFRGDAQNILARVTGKDNTSLIDGTIQTENLNPETKTNLYLLNPNGFVFGKNARLDVSGSFYASTAKGIKLSVEAGEGTFSTDSSVTASNMWLSAPPVAFGFLESNGASITIEGNTIKNSTFLAPKGKIEVNTGNDNLTIEDSTLYAPDGKVTIDAGDVELKVSPSFSRPLNQVGYEVGNIDVMDKEEVAGHISITAKGTFLAEGAQILAETGDSICIFSGNEMKLMKNTFVNSRNMADNQYGSITLTSRTSLLIGHSLEELQQYSDGEAYSTISTMSRVSTNNYGSGIGGKITINTPELEMNYGLVETTVNGGTGKSGNIEVTASNKVLLNNHGFINAGIAEDAGAGAIGGDINIDATNMISLTAYSAIGSPTLGNKGNAGNVVLKTGQLSLEDHAMVSAFSYESQGQAGSITVTANMVSLLDDSSIVTEASHSPGGNINLQVRDWLRLDRSKITAKSWGNKPGDNGGNLTINAPPFNKLKGFTLVNSELRANANRGHGGIIDFYVGKITVDNGRIDVSSRGGFNGNLFINSFRLNEAVILPEQHRPDEKPLLPSRCASFSKENMSRFLINARDILPRSPEDLRY